MTKRKNWINNLLTKKFIIPLVIFIVIFGIYAYKNTTSFHENDRENPSGPTEADIDYDKFCSLLNLYFDAQTQDFELHDYRCSKDVNFQGKIPEGQEATVDIFTKNFEVGRAKFKDWLKDHGLEESDKLRITFQHKPQ